MQDLFDRLPTRPNGNFSEFAKIEVRPPSRIQWITAAHHGRNAIAIPRVTHHDDAGVIQPQLDERRKAWNQAHPDTRRTMLMPLSLGYDHRAINGTDAARFVRHIADHLPACGYT